MGGRILVVDDDATLRDSVARVLEDEGYSVDQATDGMDALRRITENPPDAILLDVLMPKMNGRQLLEALHGNDSTASIPVLVMTAMHGIDPPRTIQLGASDLVQKPFDVDELLNKVALAIYRAGDPAAEVSAGARAPIETSESSTRLKPSDGVVLLVSPDSAVSQQLDQALAAAGFTMVSVTRPDDELKRLARVLEPQAIVLDARQSCAETESALRRLRDAGIDVRVLALCSSPEDCTITEELGATATREANELITMLLAGLGR